MQKTPTRDFLQYEEEEFDVWKTLLWKRCKVNFGALKAVQGCVCGGVVVLLHIVCPRLSE